MLRPPRAALALAVCSALACTDRVTAPPATAEEVAASRAPADPNVVTPALIRQLAAGRGIVPIHRPRPVREPLVRLGQALLFDRELSANRDIACSTCHLPSFATGDGRSLSIGQGATGLGPDRVHPTGRFIPRNAPPLFNLGAMQHLFWDGRVQRLADGRIDTPAGAAVTPAMQRVFEFGPISALALFPVTNRDEMRGGGDNELTSIPDDSFPKMWAALMRRLGAIPEYRRMFEAAYPGTRFERMNFAYASNAIGGFLVDRLTMLDSPWDRFLAGNDRALTQKQLDGAQSFLTLKCSLCHNGSTFSDEQFHDVAVAQIGPGEGDGALGRDDFGRMRVTGLAGDRYRFRTTPLRNVELTGPYGHDGAIGNLRDFVEHYSESDLKLMAFDGSALEPSLRLTMQPTKDVILAQRDTLLQGVVLTPELVDRLTTYMQALTDDAARDLSRLAPRRVPSRLPVDRPASVMASRAR